MGLLAGIALGLILGTLLGYLLVTLARTHSDTHTRWLVCELRTQAEKAMQTESILLGLAKLSQAMLLYEQEMAKLRTDTANLVVHSMAKNGRSKDLQVGEAATPFEAQMGRRTDLDPRTNLHERDGFVEDVVTLKERVFSKAT